MKNQVGAPVIIAVVVVLLLIIGGVGWSMFGPKAKSSGSQASREQIFKEHPEAEAHFRAAQQNGGASAPPPGARTGSSRPTSGGGASVPPPGAGQ